MTVAPYDIREALANPLVRRRLVAMVSRRVPADATEDVVQSVLCDALEARDVPPAQSLPRWLHVIARNKVADFHRRARRQPSEPEIEAASTDPIEERDLLERAAEVAPDPRAFEWIVRAESGVSLAEIAREEDLPAPVVRQRVSRLRRALRTALLVAAALALAVLVFRARREERPIRADRAAAASLDGRWHVVRVDCAAGAPAECTSARGVGVRIAGNTATIETRAGSLAIDIADTVREYHVRVRADGDTLRVETELGAVTLTRD